MNNTHTNTTTEDLKATCMHEAWRDWETARDAANELTRRIGPNEWSNRVETALLHKINTSGDMCAFRAIVNGADPTDTENWRKWKRLQERVIRNRHYRFEDKTKYILFRYMTMIDSMMRHYNNRAHRAR